MSLLHIPSNAIEWVGLEAAGSGITHGSGSTAGTHIVYIGSAHHVDIQVASATSIRVHNGADIPVTGNVTLI